MDSEAKRITEMLAPIEKHLEDEESRIEAERARIAAEEEARRRAAEKAKVEHALARVQALAQFGGYQGLMTPLQIGDLSEMEFDEMLDEYRARWESAEAERKAEEQRLEQIRSEQAAEAARIAEERRIIEEERRRLAAEKAAREREEARAEAERQAKFQADLEDIARQAEEIKANMEPEPGSAVEISESCDTCRPAIERAAMIKALEWVKMKTWVGAVEIDAAIDRLRNGGDL